MRSADVVGSSPKHCARHAAPGFAAFDCNRRFLLDSTTAAPWADRIAHEKSAVRLAQASCEQRPWRRSTAAATVRVECMNFSRGPAARGRQATGGPETWPTIPAWPRRRHIVSRCWPLALRPCCGLRRPRRRGCQNAADPGLRPFLPGLRASRCRIRRPIRKTSR